MEKATHDRLTDLTHRLLEETKNLCAMVKYGSKDEDDQGVKADEIRVLIKEINEIYDFEALQELVYHPSYTARIALPDLTLLAGKERLELWHDGQWITGRTGLLIAGQSTVFFPDDKQLPEYFPLTPGVKVRRVVHLQGDSYLPRYDKQYRKHEARDIR